MTHRFEKFAQQGSLAALAALGLHKLADWGAANAFKRMVRSGGPTVVESAAANPFKALAKGAVPAVDRSLTASPFSVGFAQSRAVPGFGQAGLAPVAAGFEALGGKVAPQAVDVFRHAPAPAAAPAAMNPLQQRLQARMAGGVKAASFVDRIRSALGHAPPIASGVQAVHSHVPTEMLARGAQGLTEAGHAHLPSATSFEHGLGRVPQPTAPVLPAAKKNPTLDLGGQVQQLQAMQQGQAPVGTADMLKALEGMSFEGLGNMSAHMPAAAPSRLSGVAA